MGRYSLCAGVAVTYFCMVCSTSIAAVTIVTPSNPAGWALYQTDDNGNINSGSQSGAAEFVGVSVPASPLPPGSIHLMTGATHGDESSQLRNSSWAGTRVDALTTLSYSTMATAWNGQQLPYLTLWLDTDGNGSRDYRLWFEPAYSSAGAGNGNPNPQAGVALNTWQTWNALNGMWYSDNIAGPGSNAITLTDYLFLKPNATIINDAGQGIGGIRVTSGFAGAGDNFNAYVDNFSIGTAAGTTTYNFELQAAGVPEASSVMVWSVLTLSIVVAGTIWRRRNSAALSL